MSLLVLKSKLQGSWQILQRNHISTQPAPDTPAKFKLKNWWGKKQTVVLWSSLLALTQLHFYCSLQHCGHQTTFDHRLPSDSDRVTEAVSAKASFGLHQLSELPKWTVCWPLVPAVTVIRGSISFMFPLHSMPWPLSHWAHPGQRSLPCYFCSASSRRARALAIAHQQSSEHFASLLGWLAIAQSDKNRVEMKRAFLDT